MFIQTSAGKNFETDDTKQPLMKILMDHEIPVASSCGGDGVCGKCKVEILQGGENLTPPNDTELMLKNKFKLSDNLRISCQCFVTGDLSVSTPYW